MFDLCAQCAMRAHGTRNIERIIRLKFRNANGEFAYFRPQSTSFIAPIRRLSLKIRYILLNALHFAWCIDFAGKSEGIYESNISNGKNQTANTINFMARTIRDDWWFELFFYFGVCASERYISKVERVHVQTIYFLVAFSVFLD